MGELFKAPPSLFTTLSGRVCFNLSRCPRGPQPDPLTTAKNNECGENSLPGGRATGRRTRLKLAPAAAVARSPVERPAARWRLEQRREPGGRRPGRSRQPGSPRASHTGPRAAAARLAASHTREHTCLTRANTHAHKHEAGLRVKQGADLFGRPPRAAQFSSSETAFSSVRTNRRELQAGQAPRSTQKHCRLEDGRIFARSPFKRQSESRA